MADCRRLWRRLWPSKRRLALSRARNLTKTPGLRAEAESLEEILKNQAHPKNLVAVKKSGNSGGGDRESDRQDFVPGQRTR